MKKTSLSKKELKFLWENIGKLLGTFESTEIDDLNRLMDDFGTGYSSLGYLT